jgi:plastocyanin/mono/diheme cytochrome c family protein
MNTQKQISLMVALVFVLIGGCAAYTVYDQPRENSALDAQQALHAERGARIFARYCRQCHGNAGEGRIGPALNRQDLQDPTKRTDNQIWVTDTITCGRIGKIMPPWAIRQGGALNDEQIRDVATLILTNAGDGWKKAGEYSAIENQAAPVPPVDQVLAGAAITGATVRVCGQLAPATETPAATLPAGLSPKASWDQVATDNKFSVTQMAVTADTQATVNFANQGQAIHNWQALDSSGKVLKDASGKDITIDLTDPGKSGSVSFNISTPGVYKFQCQVHPADMTGQLFVLDSSGNLPAPSPAAGAAGATPAAPSTDLQQTATDNKFSATALASPAGKQITLTLDNKGSAIHNWDVTDVKDDSGKDIKTDLTDPGKSSKVTFTISKPGTYHFRCDVHPTEMTGTIVIQ